jgi:hypothetical protein
MHFHNSWRILSKCFLFRGKKIDTSRSFALISGSGESDPRSSGPWLIRIVHGWPATHQERFDHTCYYHNNSASPIHHHHISDAISTSCSWWLECRLLLLTAEQQRSINTYEQCHGNCRLKIRSAHQRFLIFIFCWSFWFVPFCMRSYYSGRLSV